MENAAQVVAILLTQRAGHGVLLRQALQLLGVEFFHIVVVLLTHQVDEWIAGHEAHHKEAERNDDKDGQKGNERPLTQMSCHGFPPPPRSPPQEAPSPLGQVRELILRLHGTMFRC